MKSDCSLSILWLPFECLLGNLSALSEIDLCFWQTYDFSIMSHGWTHARRHAHTSWFLGLLLEPINLILRTMLLIDAVCCSLSKLFVWFSLVCFASRFFQDSSPGDKIKLLLPIWFMLKCLAFLSQKWWSSQEQLGMRLGRNPTYQRK